MIDLKPANAFRSDTLPVTGEGYRIDPLPATRITALAPFPGAVDDLHARLGGFPGPGQVLDQGDRRLVWAGRDLAFAFGEGLPEDLGKFCALTDQSDGWAGLALTGPSAQAFLARRVPVDLRKQPAAGALRTILGHVPVLIILAPDRAEIWTWRSMADSLLHELTAPSAFGVAPAPDRAGLPEGTA